MMMHPSRTVFKSRSFEDAGGSRDADLDLQHRGSDLLRVADTDFTYCKRLGCHDPFV